ncbi:MAG: hypothetical protein SOW18_02620 [Peptoniphilus sp.]|nr:hypothetical protein [Peptoniphilus sp.]MDY3118415.1 hypothetical protein [Peptoniphilus sp.]
MNKMKRYLITGIVWIFIFPITGIGGLSFLLSGVAAMLAGRIQFLFNILGIDFGLVNIFNHSFGNVAELVLSLGIGLTLFIIGNILWRITKQLYHWLQSFHVNSSLEER